MHLYVVATSGCHNISYVYSGVLSGQNETLYIMYLAYIYGDYSLFDLINITPGKNFRLERISLS